MTVGEMILFGLWGALTIFLLLFGIGTKLQNIQLVNRADLAKLQQDNAEKVSEYLQKILSDTNARPTIAMMTSDQVKELATKLNLEFKSTYFKN